MTTVTIPDGNMDKTRALAERIGVDEETAYAMMLMTALLMDLRPGDEQVCEMIVKDCGHVGAV